MQTSARERLPAPSYGVSDPVYLVLPAFAALHQKAQSFRPITQVSRSQGQEGGLAPALLEWHSISGGKPTFLTLSPGCLNHSFQFSGLSFLFPDLRVGIPERRQISRARLCVQLTQQRIIPFVRFQF